MRRIGFLRREDGVAMTEFALVLPLLVLVIAGMISFGRVFFYWIEANHLANETARWAVVDRNPYRASCPPPAPITGANGCQSLQQHARNSSSTEFHADVKVCIDFPFGSPTIGSPVRVRVQKPFSLVPILDAGTITIRGSSQMRIERFDNGTSPTYYAAGFIPATGDCS
jgi:hypothetical protein